MEKLAANGLQTGPSFVALDFETANEHRAGVCAVALIVFKDGEVTREREWLVRPPADLNYFNPFNIQIHGIHPEDVADKPEFDIVWPEVFRMIDGQIVVAHSAAFDVSVLRQLMEKYGLKYPSLRIVCTCVVARKTWAGLPNYRLLTLGNALGHVFDHHDAHDDARTSGHILVEACRQHACESIEDLAAQIEMEVGVLDEGNYRPCWAPSQHQGTRKGRYEPNLGTLKPTAVTSQTLAGHNVVFTGALLSMTRETAALKVLESGGTVSGTVSRKTTLLVMGVQDYARFADHKQSSKTVKARALIDQGSRLEIVDETEFLRLLLKGE